MSSRTPNAPIAASHAAESCGLRRQGGRDCESSPLRMRSSPERQHYGSLVAELRTPRGGARWRARRGTPREDRQARAKTFRENEGGTTAATNAIITLRGRSVSLTRLGQHNKRASERSGGVSPARGWLLSMRQFSLVAGTKWASARQLFGAALAKERARQQPFSRKRAQRR